MDEQTRLRRRLIYVTERLHEAASELELARDELEALRNDPERDQRRFVYLAERIKVLRDERAGLSAERLELQAAMART